jgi:hypothetical protein
LFPEYQSDDCGAERKSSRRSRVRNQTIAATFSECVCDFRDLEERPMGMGRGILLWLLGVPLPIVILLALFWHH